MVAKRQLSEASRTKKGIMQSNTKARSSFAIHSAALASAGVAALLLGGCTQRTIEVTSEPSGAMVWLNDMQIGRTPCETAFKFYGVYDVRVVLEGYEPLVTSREAVTPVNEWPGVDLVTAPLPIHNRVKWHFALAPAAETVDKPKAEADLVARARALREMSKPVEPVTTAQPAAGEGGPVVVPAGP